MFETNHPLLFCGIIDNKNQLPAENLKPGQYYYDKTSESMQVYNGNTFEEVCIKPMLRKYDLATNNFELQLIDVYLQVSNELRDDRFVCANCLNIFSKYEKHNSIRWASLDDLPYIVCTDCSTAEVDEKSRYAKGR